MTDPRRPNDREAVRRPARGKGAKRRHPAENARMVAVGLGSAATLGMVGVMAWSGAASGNAVAAPVAGDPSLAGSSGGAALDTPIHLSAQPSVRIVEVPAPASTPSSSVVQRPSATVPQTRTAVTVPQTRRATPVQQAPVASTRGSG